LEPTKTSESGVLIDARYISNLILNVHKNVRISRTVF